MNGWTGRILKKVAPIAIFMAVGAAYLGALSLEPLSQVYTTSVSGRVHTFRVINTQSDPISVRLRMTTRDQLSNGQELREDASDQWVIFPRQLILQPGATQSVRVQYTGTDTLTAEAAYRIIAEQLPIDFSDGQRHSGISVLFRYEGSVYVRPEGVHSEIVLAEAERRVINNEFQGVFLRFENRGTTHGIMNDLVVRLTLSDASGATIDEIELDESALSILGGSNILADRSLEELVPLPAHWARGVLDVDYSMDLVE